MVEIYKQAGVDMEAGYASVQRMKKHLQRTTRPGIMGSIGAFGAMFDISALDLNEPVLVSGTDGVGTKLKLAFELDKHDTIGLDAVAMCVNDIVVQGAEPLYFLDYLAFGKTDEQKVEQIVKGIADGCKQAGCALIGGETAEMPDMYAVNEYDIAGFTVGAVEKANMITGETIQSGDILIGLHSNGVHSNGFSLVRKVLLENGGMNLTDVFSNGEQNTTLGEELLTPTRIYVQPILRVLKNYRIAGMAHITGGGFYENIPRMLPAGLGARIDRTTWQVPEIFNLIEKTGQLSRAEMFGVFNMGIGMVLAVKPDQVEAITHQLEEEGETVSVIGSVIAESGVQFVDK